MLRHPLECLRFNNATYAFLVLSDFSEGDCSGFESVGFLDA